MTPLPLAAAQDAPGLRIGEMAKISGFSVKTIRFYCDQGLLHTARSEGRYRIFSSDSLAELEIIRALRSMDVPIGELARILEVRRAGVCNCSVLKDSIATKLLSIDSRIQELQMMKSELARLLSSWQDCGGAKAEDAAKK
ncbi:MerR family transcriptional regulator [Cyanobium sp. A1C-AMD]|uniref:MerR family transcriptional regulator n=1 Tax=Cyanobium sp. A1C-AMD TaxID=2823694 RepID=UPI0020CCDE71|nr:MerR family transcriptional regulator [Cyanobium sp. A1C-AMD]